MVRQVRFQRRRPWVFIYRCFSQAAAGGQAPALARDLGERLRRLPVERHHEVVERRIGLAVGDAAGVVGAVLARVPAAHREVDAADEGERIVDEHDFLVLRAGHRVRVVVSETHAARGLPAEAVERRELPVGAEHHRVVPVEDVDVQSAASLHQVVQELAEQRRGSALGHRVEVQLRLAVEVPAEDRDRTLRAQRRLVERAEIVLCVDEQRDALGPRHGEGVMARPEDAVRTMRR
jgi:hypothetical protein